MLSALGDALKVTVFGMAIVFVMLIIIILAVKFIEPVRRFFAGLFKRDKKESSPAKGDSAGSNANTADPGIGAVNGQSQAAQVFEGNHYDLEENSRIEMLIEFKVSYGNSLRAVMGILAKFRPDMDIEKRQEFVYAFFPFMFGIYPYTVVTEKQKKAMKEAGVDYTYNSVYELTYTAVKKMLK